MIPHGQNHWPLLLTEHNLQGEGGKKRDKWETSGKVHAAKRGKTKFLGEIQEEKKFKKCTFGREAKNTCAKRHENASRCAAHPAPCNLLIEMIKLCTGK